MDETPPVSLARESFNGMFSPRCSKAMNHDADALRTTGRPKRWLCSRFFPEFQRLWASWGVAPITTCERPWCPGRRRTVRAKRFPMTAPVWYQSTGLMRTAGVIGSSHLMVVGSSTGYSPHLWRGGTSSDTAPLATVDQSKHKQNRKPLRDIFKSIILIAAPLCMPRGSHWRDGGRKISLIRIK